MIIKEQIPQYYLINKKNKSKKNWNKKAKNKQKKAKIKLNNIY